LRKETVSAQQAEDGDSAFAEPHRCTNGALRRATRRLSQLYDGLLAPSGLRNTQRAILVTIARYGSATLSQLAESLVLDRSALGISIRPLEREGYVVVGTDPSDRRNRIAKLTPEGERIIRDTAQLWTAAQERFENKFGAARAKTLRDTLAFIAAQDYDDAAAVRQLQPGDPLLEFNRCNNTALRKATRRVSQLYDSVLAPTGLRSTQRSLLRSIARSGGQTLGQLAASLVLDRSALGHNLRPLERDGLIILDIDPADKRSRLAKITKKGEGKLRETAALWQVAQQRFENKFGVAHAQSLREVLAAIAAEEFDGELKTAAHPR
jgi:DNA-binding MarR family transcriptional regulator